MQRSSLLLFMEEYLWEEEWGKREVNKCSSFSFLQDKLIDKQNALPKICSLTAGTVPEGIAASVDFCLSAVIG